MVGIKIKTVGTWREPKEGFGHSGGHTRPSHVRRVRPNFPLPDLGLEAPG